MQRLLSSVAVLCLCWSRWLFELRFDQWIILPWNCLPCLKLERKYDWNGSKLTVTGSGVTSSVYDRLKWRVWMVDPRACVCMHTYSCACRFDHWFEHTVCFQFKVSEGSNHRFLGVLYLSILYFFSTIFVLYSVANLCLCHYISVVSEPISNHFKINLVTFWTAG